jgi:hypothetical protein
MFTPVFSKRVCSLFFSLNEQDNNNVLPFAFVCVCPLFKFEQIGRNSRNLTQNLGHWKSSEHHTFGFEALTAVGVKNSIL